MIRSIEIIEAMENTAGNRRNYGRMDDPQVPDSADVRLWRDHLLRFFADIDGDVTVDEIVIALEDWGADDLELIIAAARSTLHPEPIPTVEFKSASEPFAEGAPIFVPIMLEGSTKVGRLGATVNERASRDYALSAALDMAERRILRLEMALRRSGVEVELVELPE